MATGVFRRPPPPLQAQVKVPIVVLAPPVTPDDPPFGMRWSRAALEASYRPVAVLVHGSAPPLAPPDDPPIQSPYPYTALRASWKPWRMPERPDTYPIDTYVPPAPDDPPVQTARASNWLVAFRPRPPMPQRALPMEAALYRATIGLNPTSLSFSASVGGANPANQTVAILNLGGGTFTPTLGAIVENSGVGWLGGSVLGTTLTVTITVGALTQGVYTGTVGVVVSGATNTPQLVSVTLTVGPAGSGTNPSTAQIRRRNWMVTILRGF